MKIREIGIQNFKSFGNITEFIPLSINTTALVGANSSGKSNVLKALDLFFDYSKDKIQKDIFHDGNIYLPIEITVVFSGLTDEERKVFRSNLNPSGFLHIHQRIWVSLDGDEEKTPLESLTDEAIEKALVNVQQEKRGIRVIAVPNVINWLTFEGLPSQAQINQWWAQDLIVGDFNLKLEFESENPPTPEAFARVVDRIWDDHIDEIPQIEWLNSEKPTKTQLKSWWSTSLKVGEADLKAYFSDQKAVPEPDTFAKAVENFWNDHGPKIITMRRETTEKMLGWMNKLKGNLPRFVYIPSIRHLHEEMKVLKTNPFGNLLTWLLGDIPEDRKKELQDRINQAVIDVFAKSSEMEAEQRRIDIIRDTLNRFIHDQFNLDVDFEFPPPRLDEILSGKAKVIGDDGYRSPIQEKGQGVQRSVIFSILRTYCELRDQLEGSKKRNSIFAIEEPETCLHPAIKRATYTLLRRLSDCDDQVIYTTHDGYFLDVRHFDDVRVLRRVKDDQGQWRTIASHFPIENLIKDAKKRYNRDVTDEGIREVFNRFYDPAKNEGFFAKKVVLVEGQTEEYALRIYFEAQGYNIDQEQVAIISTGSVQHMDSLFIIFNELGIPCYPIFDGDKPQEPFDPKTLNQDKSEDLKEKSKRNKHHLTMFGVPELISYEELYFFPSTSIHDRVTVWEHDFETDVHSSIANYSELKHQATRLFGSDSKPLVARYIAGQVVKDLDSIPACITDLLEKVRACENHGSCLMP